MTVRRRDRRPHRQMSVKDPRKATICAKMCRLRRPKHLSGALLVSPCLLNCLWCLLLAHGSLRPLISSRPCPLFAGCYLVPARATSRRMLLMAVFVP